MSLVTDTMSNVANPRTPRPRQVRSTRQGFQEAQAVDRSRAITVLLVATAQHVLVTVCAVPSPLRFMAKVSTSTAETRIAYEIWGLAGTTFSPGDQLIENMSEILSPG